MTLTLEEKKALYAVRIEKAEKFYEEAIYNMKGEKFEAVLNRAYYSALTAARAVLILEGVDARTHDGVITMLSLKFVKPGILSQEVIKNLKMLMLKRETADYGDFETVSKEEAEFALKIAQDILTRLKKLAEEIFSSQ